MTSHNTTEPAASDRRENAPLVLPVRELTSTNTVKVNRTGFGDDDPTASVRVRHLVRGGFTLCGRWTGRGEWLAAEGGEPLCRPCSEVPAGHVGFRDFMRLGLTYRQIDYWSRRGWLRPAGADGGSGSRRTFSLDELAVGAVMARLVAVGIPPDAASVAARNGGRLPGGVRVLLDDDEAGAA